MGRLANLALVDTHRHVCQRRPHLNPIHVTSPSLRAPDWSAYTVHEYSRMIGRNIQPELGDIRLDRLTAGPCPRNTLPGPEQAGTEGDFLSHGRRQDGSSSARIFSDIASAWLYEAVRGGRCAR
jgi:hypothetical protein